jgi:signal transduction histidine kinase
VLDEVHPGPEGGRPFLENVLPAFLERLALVLAGEAPTSELRSTSPEARAPHGLDPEVALRELRLLRQVLFSVLEEEGSLPGPVRDTLLDLLNEETRGVLVGLSREFRTLLQREKAAREDAQFQRHRLYEFFRQSPAYVTIYRGPEHFIELTSALSLKLFGRDTTGKLAREAMPEFASQGVLKILDTVYATGEPYYSWELRALVDKKNDGHLEECFFNTRTHATRDANGKIDGIISHTVEITEQVLARRRLEETVRTLEHERELREQFVSTLSHDLRNPLSAAQMAAQALAREPGNVDRTVSMLRRILKGIQRADQMVEDMLDANRLQSGQVLRLVLSEFDLRALLVDIVEDLSTIHGPRFELQAPGPIRGFWNLPGLRRVVENLANNAIKYGESRTPVTISLTPKQERVLLAVHNHGEPLSASEAGALFDPYHRSEMAWRSGKQGWGIGLMLVRGMTEAHGGHVQVTSSAGIGTTFIVNLPVDARSFQRLPDENPPAR